MSKDNNFVPNHFHDFFTSFFHRQQLELAAQEIDKLKTETIEAKENHISEVEKVKNTCELDKAEIIKKLTLEHEIELDALREELENSEKVANCEAEVKRLREVLHIKVEF